jgi:hypothetical protein
MKLANVLAAVAVLGLACYVLAEDTPAPKHKHLGGQIVKIDGTNLVISVKHKGEDAKEVTVATDDKTVFTLDGKDAKLADLQKDYWVHVTPADGTATKVDAFTKKPEHKKPAGDKPSDSK